MELFDPDVPFDALIGRQQLVVDPKQQPIRIDRYLTERIGHVSRSRIQQAIAHRLILLNEQPTKASYKVQPHDRIQVHLPQHAPKPDLIPEPIPLQIVYEDAHLLVIDKPPGLVVHPAHANWSGTLLHGLLYHLQDTAYPYLVHRIDKDTSGLLLVAKDEPTQAALSQQFFYHSIHRQYLALVWGIAPDAGVIDVRLMRHPKDRRVVCAVPPDPSNPSQKGKHAITHYQTLMHWDEISLLRCELETGRTHQVRAHLRHLGHPILGDERYGGRHIRQGQVTAKYKQFVHNIFSILTRQALHAAALGFMHPALGKEMCFYSPLPDDMRQVIHRWKRKT